MKKLNFLFLFGLLSVMMLSISACSDDDDDENVPIGNSSIIGVWENQDWTYSNRKGDLRLEFKADKRGSLTFIYQDGTDPEIRNFEYVLKEESNGDLFLTIIWTGSKGFIYTGNQEYSITVSPTRLAWGQILYTRK